MSIYSGQRWNLSSYSESVVRQYHTCLCWNSFLKVSSLDFGTQSSLSKFFRWLRRRMIPVVPRVTGLLVCCCTSTMYHHHSKAYQAPIWQQSVRESISSTTTTHNLKCMRSMGETSSTLLGDFLTRRKAHFNLSWRGAARRKSDKNNEKNAGESMGIFCLQFIHTTYYRLIHRT